MTTTYEVIQRLEALEMAAGMNTVQVERMLALLDRIATDFAALNRTVEAIYDVLRDVAEHLETEGQEGQEGEP